MHEVQALMRRRLPGATSARTDWMFGFQRRGVRRCECDTDIPKPGPLPQTSHTAATVDHSQKIRSRTAARRRARTQTNEESNRSPAGTSRRAVAVGRAPGAVGPRGYPPAVLPALDDAAREGYVRRSYRVDAAAPGNYHLVVDSTALPLQTVVDLVVEAARARGIG